MVDLKPDTFKRPVLFHKLVPNVQVSVVVDLGDGHVEHVLLERRHFCVMLHFDAFGVFQDQHPFQVVQGEGTRLGLVLPLRNNRVDTLGVLAAQAKNRLQEEEVKLRFK